MVVDVPKFKPQINPISDEIDRRTQTHVEGPPSQRWEQLYGLNEKKKAEMEELRKEYSDIQAEKDQCTFHPQIVSYEPRPNPENPAAAPSAASPKENVAVEERTMLWKERKEKKLKNLKEAEEGKVLEGCTFKPQLIASATSHAANKEEPNKSSTSTEAFVASMKSVERYIEKQKSLRQQKEQSQHKAEQFAGSGTTHIISG